MAIVDLDEEYHFRLSLIRLTIAALETNPYMSILILSLSLSLKKNVPHHQTSNVINATCFFPGHLYNLKVCRRARSASLWFRLRALGFVLR